MRWKKLSEWQTARLRQDQWAPLEALITAADLDAVEATVEELTGFMDFFREDVDSIALTGVTDGQLAVTHERGADARGRHALRLTFYAAGAVGQSSPDAFQRLAKAAGALVDELQAEGVEVQEIRWTERPYISRPF